MAHQHKVFDTDAHFRIDGMTRAIKNDSATKTVLVQHDHNSERFTFELPRYIDGHDMYMCNVVQIHYINIDSVDKSKNYPGVYEVDDLQLSLDDENVVIFSWLISRNATQFIGNLSFAIHFACTTEGEDYAWNTAKHTNIFVTEGIYNSEYIVEDYADILIQWSANLAEFESRISELEQGGGTGGSVIGSTAVLDSILKLLKHAVYDTDMTGSLEELERNMNNGEVVYKWVVGLGGSYVSGTNEALLNTGSSTRAMLLAKNTGVPITYGANYTATEMSPYSPVVIPDGAVSVTVKCPGFQIAFNELKLVDGKWFRLFNEDTTPVADEVTYVFKSAESKGLYIKLRNADNTALSNVPEKADITFNYADEPEGEPVYKWAVGLSGSADTSGVAVIAPNNPARAMALAENTGVPLYYSGSGNVATILSIYSPVLIPDSAVSVTVKCPGFKIGFNELKLVDSTWYRQFTSDSTPVADEVTYVFKSAESKGLYIKLRHLTEDTVALTGVPETPDITFNY